MGQGCSQGRYVLSKKDGQDEKWKLQKEILFGIEQLCDVREIYAERLHMFPLGGNYKRDNRFAKYNWECVVCRGSKEKDGITSLYTVLASVTSGVS